MVTLAQVAEAERAVLLQRRELARFIRMSKKAAGNPADIAMCERVLAAAKSNLAEYERLLHFPTVNALFCRRALYFKAAR